MLLFYDWVKAHSDDKPQDYNAYDLVIYVFINYSDIFQRD